MPFVTHSKEMLFRRCHTGNWFIDCTNICQVGRQPDFEPCNLRIRFCNRACILLPVSHHDIRFNGTFDLDRDWFLLCTADLLFRLCNSLCAPYAPWHDCYTMSYLSEAVLTNIQLASDLASVQLKIPVVSDCITARLYLTKLFNCVRYLVTVHMAFSVTPRCFHRLMSL